MIKIAKELMLLTIGKNNPTMCIIYNRIISFKRDISLLRYK